MLRWYNNTNIYILLLVVQHRHACSEGIAQPLKDRGRSEPRTLEGLQADYDRFLSDGGHLRNAKLFHNVIASHFFDVPISQLSLE